MLDSWVQTEPGLTLTFVGLGLKLRLIPTGFGIRLGLWPTGLGLWLWPNGFGLRPDGVRFGLWPCGLWLAAGSHSNTSVVHMHDQRFSKHTLIEICPFEENTPKHEFVTHSFAPNFTPLEKFCSLNKTLGNTFCGIEFEKWPLNAPPPNRIKKNPFSLKQARFDPQSWFLQIVPRNTHFFCVFLWMRMCTTPVFLCSPQIRLTPTYTG